MGLGLGLGLGLGVRARVRARVRVRVSLWARAPVTGASSRSEVRRSRPERLSAPG